MTAKEQGKDEGIAQLTGDDLAKLAERVSLLMQVDRLNGQVDAPQDMSALLNVPAQLADVFEQAHAIAGDLSPAEVYRQVNRRISQIQAQLYLLRLEMENRAAFDPARVLDDPMAVQLNNARLDETTRLPRSFEFEPTIPAQGWHQTEIDETGAHRWMAPGPVSVACIPHLGKIDQIIEIHGNYVVPEQVGNLTICIGPVEAEIYKVQENPRHFISRLTLPAAAVDSVDFVPVAFRMTDFRQPSEHDTRKLGANIARFACRAALQSWPPRVEDDPESDDEEFGEL